MPNPPPIRKVLGMASVNDQVMQELREMVKSFPPTLGSVEIPPKCFTELQAEITEYTPDQTLKAKMPFVPTMTNPVGMQQGGFLGAMFDNVFGPFSYLIMKVPTVTLDLSLTFIRPITSNDSPITIEAEVISRTKSVVFMRGTATSASGKTLASATSHCIQLSR